MTPTGMSFVTSIFALDNGAEGQWSQVDIMGQLPLPGFGEEIRLSNSTGGQYCAKIEKRISKSVISYTTESNENTFKPDTVVDSFHH